MQSFTVSRFCCIMLFALIFAIAPHAIHAQPVLNEIMASNAATIEDADGDYPDWIELYNPGTDPVALAGYGLSDDIEDPFKWVFPDIDIAGGAFLLVFASDKDLSEPSNLHTNFKVSASGETIYLTAPAEDYADSIATGELAEDISIGRTPDGEAIWMLFDEPTPGTANDTGGSAGYAGTVAVSHTGGFYDDAVSLTLTVDPAGQGIHYTLDGSEPDASSPLYTEPISLTGTTVVRARALETGYFPGPVMTQTYFIDESTTLPVISLSTDPDNFFDYDTGIYVEGAGAAQGGYPGFESDPWANYNADWERPVHIEFYETSGSQEFSLDAGVKIFGKTTRKLPQKSLAIHFRGEYGTGTLDYQLFPDLPITEFKHFVLRAGGSDNTWNQGGVHFRDGLVSEIMDELDVEHQAYRPAIMFFNGEYWGIYGIREKVNEDFLASHFDVDPDELDILDDYHASFLSDPENGLYDFIVEGDDTHYKALIDYLVDTDLSDDANAAYLRTQLDVDNFIDYMAANIYLVNHDGPGHNCKFWRPQVDGGRYRYIMFDVDHTFGMRVFIPNYRYDPEAYKDNTIDYYRRNDIWVTWPNPPESTFLFRKIIENTGLRNQFINRLADFMNTCFAEPVISAKIAAVKATLEPEIPRHIERWITDPVGDVRGSASVQSLSAWQTNVSVVEEFPKHRASYLRGHIVSEFNLEGTADVTLDVSTPRAGTIKINSHVIESAPWSGVYFQGVPVEVTALPAPGYRFAGWTGISAADSTTASVTLTGDATITATFVEDSGTVEPIVINEINYNSGEPNPGDWVELYNPNDFPLNLEGWEFRDEDDAHTYVIPSNTVIGPEGYLVLCSSRAAFSAVFPAISTISGDFTFGLNNAGELVRLYDASGALIDSLTYDDQSPWPETPDGTGATLALSDPGLDNALPGSWMACADAGTPCASNIQPTAVEEYDDSSMPAAFSVERNYPNPFNPSTTITFSLADAGQVSVDVYNVAGQKVETLVNQHMQPGTYAVVWNAERFSTGLYFYRVNAGGFSKTMKMTLVK